VVTGEGESFAVVVFRDGGQWQVELLPERLTEDVDALLGAVRQQPSELPAIGLVDVGDDFLVCARSAGGHDQLMLSDVTAAVVDDLARQVCARIGVDPPAEEDIDDVWPVGDLDLFADLGLGSGELGELLADIDSYADEQLLMLARRLGFADAFTRVIDVALR